MKRNCVYFLLLFLRCGQAIAQQNDSSAVAKLYADFSIPDVTAFTLLGVNPDKVTRPTSPKDISTDVVNLAKSGNSIPAGLAIEWAPWMSFNTQKLNDTTPLYKNWMDFKKSRWRRDLSASFATLQDSTGSKVALGIAWCIFDHSDPSYSQDYVMSVAAATKSQLTPTDTLLKIKIDYLNKRAELFRELGLEHSTIMGDSKFNNFKITDTLPTKKILRDSLKSAFTSLRHMHMLKMDLGKIDQLIDLYLSALVTFRNAQAKDAKTFADIVADKRKQFKKAHWNAGILKIGAGQIWNSSTNTWNQIQSQKFSSFLAWGIKIATWGQGIIIAQYGHTYNDSSYKVNQAIIGGRLIGGSNNIHGSIEGVYESDTYTPIGDVPSKKEMDNLRSTIGVEIRMSDGLWVELATGITGPPADFFKNAGMIGLGSIKYCFLKESKFYVQ